jgi:steroid delta-isomerase-like uncharacterized protein
MSTPATAVSPQALIDAAKALIVTYNDKNWEEARAAITTDFVYDEVPTGRKLRGADDAIAAFQGWARAFPDSRGTIDNALVAGKETVVLEVTWRGTHRGPLETPAGSIPPTGKGIEVRAVALVEIAGDRARSQRHYFDMATLLAQLGMS